MHIQLNTWVCACDAIINAANTGGVTGFGLDEMVNRMAGDLEMKEARRAFNGIETGYAKVTPSFNHTKVKYIIHAVGPVFRQNVLNKSQTIIEKDELLKQAYRSAVLRAKELQCASLGSCLISAGVFRGDRSLYDVIYMAMTTLLEECADPLCHISLFAFTTEEASAANEVLRDISVNYDVETE